MNYDDVAMNNAIEYLRQAKEKLFGTGIDGSDLEEEGLAAKAAIEAKISDAEASLADIDTNISLESTTIPSFGAALDSGIVGTSVEDFSFEKLTPEMQESVKDTLAETGNITDIQEEKILNSSNSSLAIAFLLAIVLNNETIHALEGQDGPVSYYRMRSAEIEYIKKADPERYENELELIEQEFYNQCVEILGEPENGETYTYEWITSYIERLKNENASCTSIIKISAYDYLTDADTSSIEDISLTELNIVASNEQSISENIVYYLNASRDDYNNWNYTNIVYFLNEYGIGEEEVPWGIVLYHILNDTEFREWYKGEYGEELTEDNLVAFFGISDKINDDVSLQLRAFRYMTEEEKANYNYLIQTEGLYVANDYLNALEQFINERYGMDLGYQQFIDTINTEGGFSKMWLRFWDGYSVGGETFLNNIATTFNGNTTKTVAANESEYSQLFLLTYTQPISKEDIETMHSDGNLTDEVYEKLISMENPTLLDMGYLTGDINIDENIYEEYLDIKETENFQEYQEYIDTGINAQLLSGSYGAGNAIGYMTPMIFASTATIAVGGGFGLSTATSMTMGKYVGGGFNFLASYGSNYSKNIQSGHPRGGAMLAALLAASSEATLEYRLGRIAGLSKSDDIVDFAHDVCKSLNIQQIVLTWGRKVGSQITGEIKEELLQDLAVKMTDSTILGEPITLNIDETFDTAILTTFTTLLLNAPSNTLNLGVDIYNNSHTLFSVNLGNGQQLSLSYMDLNTFYDADTGFFDLGALKADIESKTGLELGGTDVSKVQITDPTIAITPTDSTIATPPTISEQQSSRIQNVMKEMDLRLGNGKGLELLTRYAETGDISEISAVGFRENLLDISFDNLKIELSTLMSNLATEGSTFSNNLAHRLVESQFKKISDFFFKYSTGTDTYFGADQNATRKHRYIEIINSDFLIENRDPFAKFILDNSNGKITSISEALNVVDTVINTKNMELDFANKYLIHYILKDFESIRQKYGSSNAVEFVLSFSQYADKPEYIKLKNKLVNMGLSPLESKQLLDGINSRGICSYATIANSIFSYYMDNQAQFQSDFGFSMFTEIDGVERLNTSEMLLDFYIFCNSNLGRKYLTEETKKKLGQEMFNISDNGELQINHLNFSNQTFLSHYVNGLQLDLINGYLEYKNTSIRMILEKNSSFEVENRNDYPSNFHRFSYNPNYTFSDYLNSLIKDALNNGKMVKLGVYNVPYHEFKFILNTDEQSEIITTNNWSEGGGHAVTVTGYSDDYVHVASWGKEYLIPWSDFYNNRFNFEILNIENINQ